MLDPLHGYLLLAQRLLQRQQEFASAFNFGPPDEHTVGEVVERLVAGWPGATYSAPPGDHPHEASKLHLDSRKAHHHLGWRPRRDFLTSLDLTLEFYRRWHGGESAEKLLADDLVRFGQPRELCPGP